MEASDNEHMNTQTTTQHPVQLVGSPMLLPLVDERVMAGFPSPAEDLGYKRIDLTEVLITHPQATFLQRVQGDSMQEMGIFDGDTLIIDKSLKAVHGDVVVAVIDNLFTVKKLFNRGGRIKLQAANITYPDIVPKDGETLVIFGVVTTVIKRFRR